MSFSYTGSGGLILFGCANTTYQRLYPYDFAVGSIVYCLAKAQKGKLKKLCVKEVLLHNIENNPDYVEFTYIDTLNAVWLQSELCSESDGIAAALNYYNNLQSQIVHIIEKN